MKDKNGLELELGDMIEVRLWRSKSYNNPHDDYMRLAFIEEFREPEHIIVKVRGETELYSILCCRSRKIPKEQAMLILLEK